MDRYNLWGTNGFASSFGSAQNGYYSNGGQDPNVATLTPNVTVYGKISNGNWHTSSVSYSGFGFGGQVFSNSASFIGKAMNFLGDWFRNTDFVFEGEAKASAGVQLGFKAGVLEVDAGYNTIDLGSLKGDFRNNNYTVNSGEKVIHNFASLEVGIKKTDFGGGLKYDYSYPYRYGYYGPYQSGAATETWAGRVAFKEFGPNTGGVARPDVGIGIESRGDKTFYGIDAGFGARIILGIDLNIKLGILR